MRILLDTHILIWALTTPERLDPRARAATLDAENEVLFSAASICEIAIKAALRRAYFVARPEIVAQEVLDIGFAELPVRATTAARVADLPLLHRDPFDRLLIAQAIEQPAALYTADDILTGYTDLVQRVATR